MAEAEAGRSGQEPPCWCLRRLGGSEEVYLLPEGEEVSLGRGLSVTHQLVSAIHPLLISRKHCVFKQNAKGQWTVTDNTSLNGVSLNNEKLTPQKPYILTKGNSVQVGVAASNDEKVEFEYVFVQENLEHIRLLLIPPQSGKRKLSRSKRKVNCEESEASGTEGTSSMSKAKVPRAMRDGNELMTSHKPEMSKQDSDLVASTQTPSQSTFHLTKMRQSIVELRSLNAQVQEKLKTPQQSRSVCSQQELQELQKELSCKHEEHLQRVDELRKIFQEEQGGSSQEEERRLKEQLAQTLKEHSMLMDVLNRSHQDFEQIIKAKNKELQETREEKEKVEAQKEEVLGHMSDVLDNELQCIICSEHFIQAVTLNCAHSFCSFCIESWRKRKEECPICRQAITSQTRSLVLDNCIDRMVDKLSQEMRDRRMALILERKDLAVELTPSLVPAVSDFSSLTSDSDLSPLPSDYTIMSSNEGVDDSDSDDLNSLFSDEEFDSDNQGDLFSDDDDDDDFLLFVI